ncbi:MAG: triple tyrosine motif-containing protein, partial [Bacteroidales bacterium]|nr:triple tyrosine motif-containing protein [Bacteroidales bacterium]
GTESNGVYAYNESTKQFIEWAPQIKSVLSQNKINHGAVSENGDIIIGTILDGLFIVSEDGRQLHHINVENGLQSNTVLGLASDKFGNVWLALDKGIDFISFPKSEAFKIVENDKLGALYSAAIYDNDLYIGTNQGLYRRSWQDNNQAFTLIPNTQEQVWDCRVIDNTLFVGHNSGTFVIKNDVADKISNYSGGYSIVRHPQNPDVLIQSTYSSLVVYKKSGGVWKFSHVIKDFNNLIRHLEIDHLNNIWASHLYLGVFKLKLNDNYEAIKTIKYYGKNSVLGKEGRRSYVFKVENRIVFTTGEQLYTYNDLTDSIVAYDNLNEQLKDYSSSYRIIPAPEHRYWFINEDGCACFEIQHYKIKKIKEYPRALFENQLIPNYENIIPFERDKAIVCLENGYGILNLASPEQGAEILQQKLQLREIISSDKHDRTRNIIYSDKGISIPFNWNSLNFRYSFPLFSGDNYSFHYKIEGLMDNWSEALDKPIINIKRIPPGKYLLSVKAVNRWGKSSQIHTIKFTIKSPWYQSTPAYIFYTLIFAFLAFYSRYLTIKRVKSREKRKRLVKEREIIQLRNEKLRADISFKSQQLANSTMGIIKKNEFLLSLKDKLKRQKEQLGTRYPDKYFQDIIAKIDKNIAGEDDWQLFEFNFEQAHETFLLNLKKSFQDLTPSDLRLCAYLRINLTSKEIAPLLGVSVRGVENHRSRLRKKLNLSTETNLTEFILSL